MSDASDDLNRSFDFDDHDDDAAAAFAQQLFAAMRGGSNSNGTNASSTRGDAVDTDGSASAAATTSSHTSATRLLEALEALSHDTDGDGIPQSLRGLLGQLHGASDGSAMATGSGLFPFAQLLGGSSNARFERMLDALSLASPTHVQLSGLSDLLETLALSSDDALLMSGLRVDAFVPACVVLVQTPPTMDVLLLAARALAALLEHFPSTAGPCALANGVVQTLCDKLRDLEYMDVAELALEILERLVGATSESLATVSASTLSLASAAPTQSLAAEARRAVLEHGGLVALVQFIDFFPIELQRTAARVAAALCSAVPLTLAAPVCDGFELLSQLLESADAAIVASACAAMQQLAESSAFSASLDIRARVASDRVCTALVDLLAANARGSDSAAIATTESLPVATIRQIELPSDGATSILRFFATVLASSALARDVDAAARVASLRFAALPPVVTALLAREASRSDHALLRDTLKLVIALLPIREELVLMPAVPTAIRACARSSVASLVRVCDATPRSDVRFECLGVLHRCCAIIFDDDDICGAADVNTVDNELTQLAAFIARILRPKATRKLTTRKVTTSDADALPVHLALEIVESLLAHAGRRRASVVELMERYGVATAIRFYANPTGQSDGAEEIATNKTDTYDVVASSTRLVATFFGPASAATSRATQLQTHVRTLERMLQTLDDGVVNATATEQQLVDALVPLQHALVCDPNDTVTAHDVASSGLVHVLLQLLALPKGQQAFGHVFVTSDNCNNALQALVTSLHDAIASEKDAFAVESSTRASCHDDGRGDARSVSQDLEQLAQHIKVRVLIDDSDIATSSLSAARDTVSSHEPPAATHWFTKHALRRSSSSRTDSTTTTHSPTDDLYTRSRQRLHDTVVLVEPLARIATLEAFVCDKLFGASSTHDDDDSATQQHGPDDDDDDADADAAADGTRSDSKRVQTLFNGAVLQTDSSVVEALVKSGFSADSSDAPLDTARIWSRTPHAITFRVLSTAAAAARSDAKTDVATASVPTANAADTVCLRQPSFMWWDDVWDVLALLKRIRDLFVAASSQRTSSTTGSISFTNAFLSLQVARVLQQPLRVVTNTLPPWSLRVVTHFAFVIAYNTRVSFAYALASGSARAIQFLCRSVWRQAVLDEPVARSGTFATATTTSQSQRRSSLNPENTGMRRFGSTGTTSDRRVAAVATIAQMVKLPRLKVRVARLRLLQSARKLLALYGGKRAAIEIEFVGEVGTGNGPTTEFYALVCELLQSKQLQLWRDDVPETADSVSTKRTTAATNEAKAPGMLQSALCVRGFHRIAVFRCRRCLSVRVPHCTLHDMLLTHRKPLLPVSDTLVSVPNTIAQCAECLDTHDWHAQLATCDCEATTATDTTTADTVDTSTRTSDLEWWLLSTDEAQYLAQVFPHHVASVRHPVLQCAHCATVNFPGTDAGIVTLDATNRMVSRSGRRMAERDYRAVTRHVTPLCEGTRLVTRACVLSREAVDRLVALLARSPEVLERDVDALTDAAAADELDFGPDVEFGINEFGPDVAPDVATKSFVVAPRGLFPQPFVAGTRASATALQWFTFIGQFVAQAMLDERLLDLPLARPFLRALRGEALVGPTVPFATSLGYICELDPAIGASLRFLDGIAQRAVSQTLSAAEWEALAAEVEAMALTFTLVGTSAIELCKDGATRDVALDNVNEFVTLQVTTLLETALTPFVTAFATGFASVVGTQPHERNWLAAFDTDELAQLVSSDCRVQTLWDRDGHELRTHMVCAHGYTAESRAVTDLVAILCGFPLADQRLFVRFVTGASRLPVGGLAHLEPKLTVVRKFADVAAVATGSDSERGTSSSHSGYCAADAVLPSASTCTNYLKLPEYSTRDVMAQRLLFCIREGQGSFHLS